MLAPIVEIFCDLDDFYKQEFKNINAYLLPNPHRQRQRPCRLSSSEIMTIMVLFHLSHYRTFKDYYHACVLIDLRAYFPQVVSYNRFVELMPHVLLPLLAYLLARKGQITGQYYVDSTDLPVCHNRRIYHHATFRGIAQRGKTSVDWFYGLKLHLVINQLGELMSFSLTQGNVDDRTPLLTLFKELKGLAAGDRGYISQKKTNLLAQQGLTFLTRVRRNMKATTLTAVEKFFLSKRCLVELVIAQLKSLCQIDHTRHRSPINFLVNLFSGLAAYIVRPRKLIIKKNNFIPILNLLTPN